MNTAKSSIQYLTGKRQYLLAYFGEERGYVAELLGGLGLMKKLWRFYNVKASNHEKRRKMYGTGKYEHCKR